MNSVILAIEQYLMSYGTVQGNTYKNVIIWWSGGIVIGILMLIATAKLFLLYKESTDLIYEKFIQDVAEGTHHHNVAKKPIAFYKPEGISVMKWQSGKDSKDISYLIDPTTVPEVIDAIIAVIILKINRKSTYSYADIKRAKFIFYGILFIAFVVAAVGIGLSMHINGLK